MNTMVQEACSEREVYGFIRELEERVLYMKQGDYSWGGEDDGEKAKNNLYGLALLTFLNDSLDENYLVHLDDFLHEAEKRFVSDREYLLPFILGQFVRYKHYFRQKKAISKVLHEVLQRAEEEMQSKRWQFSTEYLFSMSYFFSLIGDDVRTEFKETIGKAQDLAEKLSKLYNREIIDDETKTKLLYILASFSKTKEQLKKIHEGFKEDVEGLRKRVNNMDQSALLVKPYTLLGIQCYRTIISDLKRYFRENPIGVMERDIRESLTRYSTFGGLDNINKNGLHLSIEQIEDDVYEISMRLSGDKLHTLLRQVPQVSFVCKITLALCSAGFCYVYTIPGHERDEYYQFKASRKEDKYRSVKKEGLEDVLERASNCEYLVLVARSLLLFFVVPVIIIALSWITGLIAYSPVWIIAYSIIIEIIYLIKKTPEYSLINLIGLLCKKKDIKKKIRKNLESSLGLGE
ncbi:MAG: hypothetical protein QHH00_05985 [Methanomassiliicoccales archaeon]|jgi:hypothetical protein|nr:hypothetical protein [Methanomassiliicoccales archaeon]